MMMIKTNVMSAKYLGLFMLLLIIFPFIDAEALQGQGVGKSQYGSATKHIVCGDRLCSEIQTVSVEPIIEINETPLVDESLSELLDKFSIDISAIQIETVHVAGNVSLLVSVNGMIGGNIAISSGDDGILIVDDGMMFAFDDIKEQLTQLQTCNACDDVEFLINTHWHFDHTENNENFGKEDTIIIAHENVRNYLTMPREISLLGMKWDAEPKEALPVITFEDSISIHFNDEEIQVIHVPSGHTNSDSFVYFTESNVLHLGDHFSNMPEFPFPFIDLQNGGSVQGLITNIGNVIDEFPKDVKIIPGHGFLSDMDDLINYHAMLVETSEIIKDQFEDGKTLEEIQETGLSEKWAAHPYSESYWIEIVYTSLSNN